MPEQTATEYLVLLHGDERAWAAASAEQRAATFALHDTFTERCAERGHKITGGAELQPSTTARLVRRTSLDAPLSVTDGPYTETTEQFGGYYVIETSDLDDLAELVGHLLDQPGDVAEIRPTVPMPADGA